MLKGKVLEVSRREVAFLQLLLLHPPHDHIDHLPLIPADQQYLLTLMQRYQCWLLSLELPGRHADIALGLADGLDEILLQLIPEHLPESSYFRIILAVLLYPIHNTHGPLHRHRFEAVLLIEVGIHMRFQCLHGGVGLVADLVVLGLGGVDLVYQLFELVQSEVLVKFYVDVGRSIRISASAFSRRFGLLSLDDVGNGSLKHVILAVLGDLFQQLCVLGL